MRKLQPKTRASIIPMAAILGFSSLIVMRFNVWAGMVVLAIAIALVVVGVKNNQMSQTPEIKTIVSEYEVTERNRIGVFEDQALFDVPTPARGIYQPLLTKLRMKGINTNAPVIETDTTPITVKDIVIEIGMVIDAKDLDLQAMVEHMPKLYDMIWDYTAEATEKYHDVAQIKSYIAASVISKHELDNFQL